MNNNQEFFEERIIPRLKAIFKDSIKDIEIEDDYEMSFQTWEVLSGGHNGNFDTPLQELINLCTSYGLIYTISGTGDADTPNRLKISLMLK